jgi:hypothetical protein
MYEYGGVEYGGVLLVDGNSGNVLLQPKQTNYNVTVRTQASSHGVPFLGTSILYV